MATVVGMIANGMAPDEVVTELPPLKLEDVAAALRFAADTVADREMAPAWGLEAAGHGKVR